MILRLYRISGHSMLPTLKPDDRIIVSSIPYFFSSPKIGDIVLFKHKNKEMVKRIINSSNEKYLVEGDNKSDSLKVNSIKKSQILGKIIL